MTHILSEVLDKFSNPGTQFENDSVLHRQALVLFSILHAALIIFFIFFIYNFSRGEYIRSIYDFVTFIALIPLLYYLYNVKNIRLATYLLGGIMFISLTGLIIIDKNNSFVLVWIYAYLVLTIPLIGLKIGTIVTTIFYLIITTLSFNGINEWNYGTWNMASFYSVLISSVFFIFAGYFLESSYVKANDELIKSREQEKTTIKELERISRSDQLTGLYNRRYFSERLMEEVERIKRNHTSACLIMLDIDFFKSINDTYGHPSGDLVLQEISATLRSILRSTDLLARWGGEEFMILLPETNPEHATIFAERMRKAIEEMTIKDVKKVTASFGVVEYDNSVGTIETALRYVDDALYKAKAQGRNKVVLAWQDA